MEDVGLDEVPRTRNSSLESLLTVLIVHSSLERIGEYVIGFSDETEDCSKAFVPLSFRIIMNRQPAIAEGVNIDEKEKNKRIVNFDGEDGNKVSKR